MSDILLVLLVLLVAGLAALLVPWPPVEAALAWQRWSAGLRRYALRIDTVKWVYLGGGRGEVVLMIHGFGGDKDNFTALAAELTDQYRVIIPDLPGFGESDPPTGTFDLDAQTARLAAFVAALGVRRAHLVGNSMGGYLAANLARMAPDLVASLWLIAPGGVADAPKTDFIRAAENRDIWLVVRTDEEHRRMFDLCFGDRVHVPEFVRRGLAKRAFDHADLWERAFEEAFAEITPLERLAGELTCPVLITWGDLDKVLSPEGANTLAESIPNARVHIAAGTGHLPMTEQPGSVAREWRRWRGAPASASGGG